jgi:PAP2 superfamily
MKGFLEFLILCLLAMACSTKHEEYKKRVQHSSYIHRSVKQVTDRIVHDIFSPPVASRIYAYTTIAGYEALRPQEPHYKSLAGQLHGLEPVPQPDSTLEYCFPLASSEAILKVGRALVFSEPQMDEFIKKIREEFRKDGVPEDVFDRSVAYGSAVAEHIIKWSGNDNYKQSRSFPKYEVKNDISSWKPTPPAYMDAVEPHWNMMRTFVIDSAQEFKPLPAIPFSIDKNSPFFKAADEVYAVTRSMNMEQTAIASFWDCNPFVMNVKGHVMFATKKISPGGHWINITRVACEQTHADQLRTAESYAMVSIALADAFISCWDEKYRSNVIRPETYINQHIDATWVPLLQTPPFPEYTSGHSVISGAAAVTLTRLFGDNFAYTDSTEVEYGMTSRKFTSFIQASEEAAVSRLYGGIHYRESCEQGKVQGRALGEFILKKINTH